MVQVAAARPVQQENTRQILGRLLAPAPCVQLANMAQLDLIPLKLRRARHAQRAPILQQMVCVCTAPSLSLQDTCLNLFITPPVVLAPRARMYQGKT